MPVVGMVLAYTCTRRYGPSYQCSAAQFWGSWAFIGIIGVVIVVNLIHQGIRHRGGKRSIYGWVLNRRVGRTRPSNATVVNDPWRFSGGTDPYAPVTPSAAAATDTPGADTFVAPVSGVPTTAPSGPSPAPESHIGPAGWYSNPSDPADIRYWTGELWLTPAAEGAAAPPRPASAPPAWSETQQ